MESGELPEEAGVQDDGVLRPDERLPAALLVVGILLSIVLLAVAESGWMVAVGIFFWLWAVRNVLTGRGASLVKLCGLNLDMGIVSHLFAIVFGAWHVAAGCLTPALAAGELFSCVIIGLNFGSVPLAIVFWVLQTGKPLSQAGRVLFPRKSVPFGQLMCLYCSVMVAFWLLAAPATTLVRLLSTRCAKRF